MFAKVFKRDRLDKFGPYFESNKVSSGLVSESIIL